jgi:hypothetical protein
LNDHLWLPLILLNLKSHTIACLERCALLGADLWEEKQGSCGGRELPGSCKLHALLYLPRNALQANGLDIGLHPPAWLCHRTSLSQSKAQAVHPSRSPHRVVSFFKLTIDVDALQMFAAQPHFSSACVSIRHHKTHGDNARGAQHDVICPLSDICLMEEHLISPTSGRSLVFALATNDGNEFAMWTMMSK